MSNREAGKGSEQRPTDHKKWSNGYDNIKWTKEEDEEFDRLQDRIGSERAVAQTDRHSNSEA
jgi:hypothetical protein